MRKTNPKQLKAFGRNLAEKRMALELDKRQFASKCGISYKHYFNLESGAIGPSLPAYIAICRVLGIQVPLVS